MFNDQLLLNRVRLRRSNTITSRVPGLSSQAIQSSDTLTHGTHLSSRGENPITMPKELENGQKSGWTSKFNSMGSNSSSTVTTGNSNSTGNTTSQINICLECKDVVDNIGRKNNMSNAYNHLDEEENDQKLKLRSQKSSNVSLSRDMRNLHTQSMIIE